VANRVDLFSEFDLSFKKRFGARVSASLWVDDAYRNKSVSANPAFDSPFGNTSLNTPGGTYSNSTKRFSAGPSGEFQDAFVYAGFDAGTVPIDIKLGRHNIYWGESLFSFMNGISYSQGRWTSGRRSPARVSRPRNCFCPEPDFGQAQLSDTVTLAGQYFLEWKPTRLPDGGTYFGYADFLGLGGGGYVLNPAARTEQLSHPDRSHRAMCTHRRCRAS